MFEDNPNGSKNPVGAMTPSSFSKDILMAVEAFPVWAGANAAAPARREAHTTSFIFKNFTTQICATVVPGTNGGANHTQEDRETFSSM